MDYFWCGHGKFPSQKQTHYPTVEQVAQGHPWSETFELSARVSWYFSTALTLILNMFNMLFSMGVEVWLSAGSQLFVCQNFEPPN